MEFRKLGNKTKMVKLMSNVGNYGLIILTLTNMLDSKSEYKDQYAQGLDIDNEA